MNGDINHPNVSRVFSFPLSIKQSFRPALKRQLYIAHDNDLRLETAEKSCKSAGHKPSMAVQWKGDHASLDISTETLKNPVKHGGRHGSPHSSVLSRTWHVIALDHSAYPAW